VASARTNAYATSARAPSVLLINRPPTCMVSFFCQSLLRGLTSVCILTDNQAYHTLLYGRISGRNSARLRILRRINRLIFQYKCNLQIMWIPTSDNLADAFSRLSTSYSYPNQSINILPCISTCRTIKRYWWHSLA